MHQPAIGACPEIGQHRFWVPSAMVFNDLEEDIQTISGVNNLRLQGFFGVEL
jgi:hypothetical protein